MKESIENFKVGDICTHPTFGKCKVTMLDKARGLVQVKWPENSSSQAHWSLVEPKTLKKSESLSKAKRLLDLLKEGKQETALKLKDMIVTHVKMLAKRAGAHLEFEDSDFDGDTLQLSFSPDDLVTMSSGFDGDDLVNDLKKNVLKGSYQVMFDVTDDGFNIYVSGIK